VAQPTQLSPTEQDALVKQIGLAMLRVAPTDWEQLTVDYRAVGRYAESTGQVTYGDGSTEPWTMPDDLKGLFTRLRGGMYREGRGTWFNARYRLDHPSSYNLEYDREEPGWDLPPPPQAYPDDMRLFPRSDENVPEWLRRRLASAPPLPGPAGPGAPGPDRPIGPPTTRFRVARIFDGPGEDGRPSVNRPQVDDMDITDVLDYLDGAPLVGPARGYDVDRLDPNGQQSVPVAFHTDGTWIWPAAVNYYLREHDIAPEADLVEHIRRMRFKLVPVDDQTRAAAQAFLGPPPGGPGGPGGPPVPRPAPPAPAPTRALPVPPPAPAPSPGPVPPRAALPSQGPPSQQIDQLRARLEDLDVPDTAYRIGQPTGRGWAMEQTDEGWRVGWHDREWVAPAMFEDVADASAFLLGKLLLDTDRWAAGPKNPELPPPGPAEEDLGFQPMSAPIDAFEPMAAPMEDYGHQPAAGPVKPPPGTPGYGDSPNRYADSPAFADAPGFTEPGAFGDRSFGGDSGFGDQQGFSPPPRQGPPPGTPPRPAPTMAMEQPRGMDAPAHGLDSPAHGLDTPGRGLDSPPRGFDSPGRGADSPPRGIEMPRNDQATVLASRPTNGAASAPAGSEWPITPLPGEPPLTLFRGKRVVELEPGMEIDRFGDDDGNLVYAVGTPFSERSLVPEWIDRPYHVYRVRQHVQVLTGAAIPWFDQPGGGTAFLLPDAVGDMVAHGQLMEVSDRERPQG
jgi:Tuberculosis necrotizing toxin